MVRPFATCGHDGCFFLQASDQGHDHHPAQGDRPLRRQHGHRDRRQRQTARSVVGAVHGINNEAELGFRLTESAIVRLLGEDDPTPELLLEKTAHGDIGNDVEGPLLVALWVLPHDLSGADASRGQKGAAGLAVEPD